MDNPAIMIETITKTSVIPARIRCGKASLVVFNTPEEIKGRKHVVVGICDKTPSYNGAWYPDYAQIVNAWELREMINRLSEIADALEDK